MCQYTTDDFVVIEKSVVYKVISDLKYDIAAVNSSSEEIYKTLMPQIMGQIKVLQKLQILEIDEAEDLKSAVLLWTDPDD